MGAIHNKIKRLREQCGLTQQEIADKLSIHLKTYQKIENGITRLDIERIQQIAEILETSVEDLLNADEGVFISNVDNDVVNNNGSVTINNKSEDEKLLYERIIAEKDIEIKRLLEEVSYLKDKLDQMLIKMVEK